ncbi:toxin-antitoxin system YwqK family antitoxin [Carboxylicivirga sp. N1Y90]|uniref:toxin-antitoxin system YwqK family antitoxin n=1 Tax=Carboxylicivirga fragile TaxID=3417571 RepID=UPI003D32BBE4|nr:hypothetical protein [Marinilabiliaceae bacterium N1Y90]
MKNLVVLSAIALIALSSCQFFGPDKKVVTKGEKNPDGIVIKKRHFNDDPHSPIEWKISMKPSAEGSAVRHGKSIRYTKSGKVAEVINYVENKKEGKRLTYHSTGKIYKEQSYLNNKLDGVCKRYDREGKLVAEYPYKGGLPGVGLKEFTNLGKERPAPVLSLKKVDKIRTNGSYVVVCSLTGEGAKRIKSVEFYQGDLLDGKYQHRNLKNVKKLSGKSGEFSIALPKGASVNKTLNFVAVASTSAGLKYIIQKKITIDARGV